MTSITPGTQPEILGQGYGFTEGPAADRLGERLLSRTARTTRSTVGKPASRPHSSTDNSTDAIGMMFNADGASCTSAKGRPTASWRYDVHYEGEARAYAARSTGSTSMSPTTWRSIRHNGFYFSDPNYQHRGEPTVMKQDVYYCSSEGKVTRVSTICFKPNGVLLSADDRSLYVADARGQLIYRYDVTGPGQLSNERLWIDKLAANPDGLTLDQHENLYICCGKAGLKIFDRTGQPIGHIGVHAANCCFGGHDFRTLCIASVDKFLGLRTNVVGMKPLALQ